MFGLTELQGREDEKVLLDYCSLEVEKRLEDQFTHNILTEASPKCPATVLLGRLCSFLLCLFIFFTQMHLTQGFSRHKYLMKKRTTIVT